MHLVNAIVASHVSAIDIPVAAVDITVAAIIVLLENSISLSLLSCSLLPLLCFSKDFRTNRPYMHAVAATPVSVVDITFAPIDVAIAGVALSSCCMPYVTEDSPTHESCSTPPMRSNGFIFARIQGGFHEIRNLICDVVVVSRLLNATLIIPEIQSTTSRKGISSEFKSFAYLYNEDQFMVALEKDVKVVKTLPKNLKGERRKEEITVFRVPYSASRLEPSSCLKQAFVKYWHAHQDVFCQLVNLIGITSIMEAIALNKI